MRQPGSAEEEVLVDEVIAEVYQYGLAVRQMRFYGVLVNKVKSTSSFVLLSYVPSFC